MRNVVADALKNVMPIDVGILFFETFISDFYFQIPQVGALARILSINYQ
jgi:hypothetical protein